MVATIVTLTRPAPGQVWGSVVDSVGQPVVRDATVDVSAPGFRRLFPTDKQGQFVIRDAPAGHRLTVQVFNTYNDFSARTTVIPPDTVPPILFPASRESRGLRIDSAYVAKGVQGRDPRRPGCVYQSCDDVYGTDVGQVYFWTIARGTTTPRSISHVWYWEDQQMARVDLVVRGPKWRTWSSKRIDPSWNGRWRIEVLADDGTVLLYRFFVIQSNRDTIGPAELQRLVSLNVWEGLSYLRLGWMTQSSTHDSVYVNDVFQGTGLVATQHIPLAGVRLIRRLKPRSGNAAGRRIEIYTAPGARR